MKTPVNHKLHIPIHQMSTGGAGPCDDHQLSDAEKRQIDSLLTQVPEAQAIAIDALKLVQENRGWVSDITLSALAHYTQIPLATLDGIATFYNLIFRRSVGQVVLHPCDGISCELMGGAEVRAQLGNLLNLLPGQTTDDDHFTLVPLPCLGACDKAPVMIANKHLYEYLHVQDLDSIITKLKVKSEHETHCEAKP